MNTTHQLHQILSDLVDSWPGDYPHPMVDHARYYLQHAMPGLMDASADHGSSTDEHDDYHDALWYSL